MGEWSLNKRNYMAAFPPKHLQEPPQCAGACAHRLWSLWTEAANALPNWPSGGRGALGWVEPLAPTDFDAAAPAAAALLGTGPWSWRGRSLFFLQDGVFVADPPSAAPAAGRKPLAGSWRALPGGRSGLRVQLDGCGEICALSLSMGGAPSAFEASCAPARGQGRARESRGTLAPVPAAVRERHAATVSHAPAELAARVEGSGPWSWDGAQSLFFLAGGRLVTPWAEGEWRYARDGRGVHADFVGEKHTLSFGQCLGFSARARRSRCRVAARARAASRARARRGLTPRAPARSARAPRAAAAVRKRDGAKSKGALTQPEGGSEQCRLDA